MTKNNAPIPVRENKDYKGLSRIKTFNHFNTEYKKGEPGNRLNNFLTRGFFILLTALMNLACHRDVTYHADPQWMKADSLESNLPRAFFVQRIKPFQDSQRKAAIYTDTIIDFTAAADTVIPGFPDNRNDFGRKSDSIYVMVKAPDIHSKKIKPLNSQKGYLLFERPVEIEDGEILPSGASTINRSDLLYGIFDSSLLINKNTYTAKLRVANSIFRAPVTIVNPSFKPLAVSEKLSFVNCAFAYCLFQNGISFNNKGLPPEKVTEPDRCGSRFNHDLYFLQCNIKGKLDFSECSFDSGSYFNLYESKLPDTLDLSDCKFTKTIDLTATRLRNPDKNCEIGLIGCDIDKIKMQYGNFHLFIPPAIKHDKYEKDLVNSTYESLLANFQKNGYKESYKKLSIEYKDWQAEDNWGLWISKCWWQYGYEKWYVLLWTLGFLGLFSVINACIYQKIYSTYTILELDINDYYYSKKAFWRVLQKYWLSVMYTGCIFFKISIDFDKIKIKTWSLLLLLFFEYMIGLLCTAYLVNWVLSK